METSLCCSGQPSMHDIGGQQYFNCMVIFNFATKCCTIMVIQISYSIMIKTCMFELSTIVVFLINYVSNRKERFGLYSLTIIVKTIIV